MMIHYLPIFKLPLNDKPIVVDISQTNPVDITCYLSAIKHLSNLSLLDISSNHAHLY